MYPERQYKLVNLGILHELKLSSYIHTSIHFVCGTAVLVSTV
jgi:hypothetical protein